MKKYSIKYYSDTVAQDVLKLPKTLIARFLRYIDIMEQEGPNIGMPHTKAIGDGLFELRLKGLEGIARVFYCAIIKQQIVILHSFVKKTEKTPNKELSTAIKRMKEINP